LLKRNINIIFWDMTPCTLVDTSAFEVSAFEVNASSVFRLHVAYLHNYSITCQT